MAVRQVVYAGTGRGFVRMSAAISPVGPCSGSSYLSATFSRTKWYAMSMCFVLGEETGLCMTASALW